MSLGFVTGPSSKRVKPRLQVLRGWDPMNPTTMTSKAAVASGVTIRSGQLISKSWNGSTGKYEFVLGNSGATTPVLAWSDSADMDVVESGILTGLSCVGKFEVQTGYFDTVNTASPPAAYTYNDGTPLTWSTTTAGNVRAATTGEVIIGYVTHNLHGAKQLVDHANAVWEDSSVMTASPYTEANSKVLIFATDYSGAKVPA